jgi:hypothetical protein
MFRCGLARTCLCVSTGHRHYWKNVNLLCASTSVVGQTLCQTHGTKEAHGNDQYLFVVRLSCGAWQRSPRDTRQTPSTWVYVCTVADLPGQSRQDDLFFMSGWHGRLVGLSGLGSPATDATRASLPWRRKKPARPESRGPPWRRERGLVTQKDGAEAGSNGDPPRDGGRRRSQRLRLGCVRRVNHVSDERCLSSA